MSHPDKNRLLDYFYQEGRLSENQRTRRHLHDCHDCREYMQTLEQTSKMLNKLPEHTPPADTFDIMIREMDILPQLPVKKRAITSAVPYFQIALSIPFILAALYYFQNKLSVLPIWETLEEIWVIEKIGSFGFVAVLFFLIGSFITMALAPVLLDSEKAKKHYQVCNL